MTRRQREKRWLWMTGRLVFLVSVSNGTLFSLLVALPNTNEASISSKSSIFLRANKILRMRTVELVIVCAWPMWRSASSTHTDTDTHKMCRTHTHTQFVIFVFNYTGCRVFVYKCWCGTLRVFNWKMEITHDCTTWMRWRDGEKSILFLVTIIEFNAIFHSNAVWQRLNKLYNRKNASAREWSMQNARTLIRSQTYQTK